MYSKLQTHNSKNVINITWKGLSCELCKAELPLTIPHKGEDIMLVPCGGSTTKSYVLLELFSKENESTGVYFISLDSNRTFKIVI